MDNEPTQAAEPHEADQRDDPGVLSAEKLLPIVFYGALAIWAVSVVVIVWSMWTQSDLINSQNASIVLRLQFVATGVGATWGYLLVAVIALCAKELLSART